MIHSLRRWAPSFRFCTVSSSAVGQQQQSSAAKQTPVPVHLRPYDAKKYEVPSSKLKISTGYAFLDVDPMPRAKIMKIGYTVLEKLRNEIPEGVLYRVYTEEKIKYMMRLTDEIDDIRKLEYEFGNTAIELVIQQLFMEIELVNQMKQMKPWEITNEDESFEVLRSKHPALKHLRNEKPAREQAKFIE